MLCEGKQLYWRTKADFSSKQLQLFSQDVHSKWFPFKWFPFTTFIWMESNFTDVSLFSQSVEVLRHETYLGIIPYRTPALVWTTMYVSYVTRDLVVWENKNVVYFSFNMGKYNARPMNKVLAFRRAPYSLDDGCIFLYRTQITTFSI